MKLTHLRFNTAPSLLAGASLFGVACLSLHADVVLEWNLAMTHVSEIQPPPGIPPFLEARIFAMGHLAALGAINNATRGNGLHNQVAAHGDVSAAAAQAPD
jgi:hypothetical protein